MRAFETNLLGSPRRSHFGSHQVTRHFGEVTALRDDPQAARD
jgi:hypothetical protein